MLVPAIGSDLTRATVSTCGTDWSTPYCLPHGYQDGDVLLVQNLQIGDANNSSQCLCGSRSSIHTQDVLFAETLYQLLDQRDIEREIYN